MRKIFFVFCICFISACSSSDDMIINPPDNPIDGLIDQPDSNQDAASNDEPENESTIISNSDLNGNWIILEHFTNNGIYRDRDMIETSTWTYTGREFEFKININSINYRMISSGKCWYDQISTYPNGDTYTTNFNYVNTIYFPGLSGKWTIKDNGNLSVYNDQSIETTEWEIISFEDTILKLKQEHSSDSGRTTATYFLLIEKQ